MATQIDPARVAELITYSPGWARVALTAPSRPLRDAAAQTLASFIAQHHDDEPANADQLALPLA